MEQGLVVRVGLVQVVDDLGVLLVPAAHVFRLDDVAPGGGVGGVSVVMVVAVHHALSPLRCALLEKARELRSEVAEIGRAGVVLHAVCVRVCRSGRCCRIADGPVVEEGLGEGVVLDLEGGNLLVLVCGDGDELRGGERLGEAALDVRYERKPAGRGTCPGERLAASVDAYDVDAGLVLVEAVEHDLAVARGLVGQLDLGEVDGLLGPVVTVVGRVRVEVDWVGRGRLGLATWKNSKKLQLMSSVP